MQNHRSDRCLHKLANKLQTLCVATRDLAHSCWMLRNLSSLSISSAKKMVLLNDDIFILLKFAHVFWKSYPESRMGTIACISSSLSISSSKHMILLNDDIIPWKFSDIFWKSCLESRMRIIACIVMNGHGTWGRDMYAAQMHTLSPETSLQWPQICSFQEHQHQQIPVFPKLEILTLLVGVWKVMKIDCNLVFSESTVWLLLYTSCSCLGQKNYTWTSSMLLTAWGSHLGSKCGSDSG